MTLIVPTVGGFSIGSNVATSEPKSSMNMSLDDVIASRRKEAVKDTRRGGGRARVSAADKSVATGRAKRSAAVNARRSLTTTKKPTKMEVEREVKTQTARTQKAKHLQEIRKAGGRVAATGGRRSRAANKAAGGTVKKAATPASRRKSAVVKTKQATVQIAQANPPSKKAVNAAVQAFKANGFQIPQGTQMVIRFEQPTNNTNNSNANTGGGRGGRGGGAKNSPGGRGQNNNRNNANNTNNNRKGGGRGGGGRGGGGRK